MNQLNELFPPTEAVNEVQRRLFRLYRECSEPAQYPVFGGALEQSFRAFTNVRLPIEIALILCVAP